MAAVFALVFVPALAGMLVMVGVVRGDVSFATGAAAAVFVALSMGVFIGLLRLMRQWETTDEKRA